MCLHVLLCIKKDPLLQFFLINCANGFSAIHKCADCRFHCDIFCTGYDQIPIDMQGLEIESHGNGNGSTYGTLDAMEVGSAGNFDPIDIPTPPQENNQVAAWYDTDL